MDGRGSFDASSIMARWARRIERCCCRCATYFPLAFVYGITTWAVFVDCNIGLNAPKSSWIGMITYSPYPAWRARMDPVPGDPTR
jgi:hypothetical protein